MKKENDQNWQNWHQKYCRQILTSQANNKSSGILIQIPELNVVYKILSVFAPTVQPVRRYLGGFSDFACLDTTGTYINLPDTTLFNHSADSLKVRVEFSFIQIMGMADVVADHWFLTANCTFF